MRKHVTTLPAKFILATTVVLAAALAGCGSTAEPAAQAEAEAPAVAQAHLDGPDYTTVSELAGRADVVVRGTVKASTSGFTEAQLQGVTTDAPSLPITLNEVVTSQYLRGEGPATVLVQRIDAAKLQTEDQTPLKAGSEVLLFLRATGFQHSGTEIYSVVGMDQGYLQVQNNSLRATRSEMGSPAAGMTVDQVMAELQ